MKSTRSFSPRASRLISLPLCYSLIITTVLMPTPSVSANSDNSLASRQQLNQGPGFFDGPGRILASLITLLQGGGLPAVPGANLPDLDVARQAQAVEPEALAPIASEQVCEDCAAPCPDCEINHKPIARPGGPYFGSATQSIQFNGLSSFDPDPDDEITDFIWTFGDSSPAVEVHGGSPTHTYAGPGVYNVTLRVKDLQNVLSDVATTTATVNAAPTPTPTPAASPTPPGQTNAATFISQSLPTTMIAGTRHIVSVTMRNTGNSLWSAAHLYRLGSQGPQDNMTWGRARVYLPAPVAPGEDVVFNFTVMAPAGGGDEPPPANFQWRMVQDGVGWFGDLTTNQAVAITSNSQPPGAGVSEPGPFSDIFASRIAVQHRTGQAGEDLLSGNYNWGLRVLDLAGRSGLNLNLGLSYNSLAPWTKVAPPELPNGKSQQPFMVFDADRGFPSAGFRLGFPSIQGPFLNKQANGYSYLALMPSGSRVELRQVGTTNVYEAADSSYLQMTDSGNGNLVMRSIDGTQLAYRYINREYRCTEVKERNGNYLTIRYDPINGTENVGNMTSIVDTLGRTFTLNYDSNYRLQSITQSRNGQTHSWATFGYSDKLIETNFVDTLPGEGEEVGMTLGPPPAIVGLPENQTVSLLTQISLDDGSRYNFDYSSWGQIWRTRHYAADGHELSSTSYDLPLDSNEPQTDSPRFTQKHVAIENFNNGSPVTTTFEIDPGGQWGKVTGPDGTAHKEFFTTEYTAWNRGLVTRTETFSADSGTPKKVTIVDWTQDNLSLPYPLNPRATATTILDSDGNRRRTTVDYDLFGLPSDVFELGPSGAADWTLLRRTHTDYELSATYVNHRLIGLPKQQFLFGPEDNGQRLYGKTSYEYDAGGEFLQNQGNPVQHDANFGSGSLVRGNVTKVLRWDVDHENDILHTTASLVGYNTCGSAVFTRDPLGHQITTSYADSFSSDGINTTTAPNLTLAYPTAVTVSDPAAISSTAKYHFDLGRVTRQQDPKGAVQTTEFDSAGRVKRVTNAVNGAYSRFVYPASQTIVNKFTTIQEGQGEAYSATVLDGAGRVRGVAGDLPNSIGHYSGQFMLYDINSQVIQQTNPTEMTPQWAAAGDDSAGWRSSSQTYDWKGRPLKTTNTDGSTKEASYGGCGCAGGDVVTLTDEGALVDVDPGPGINNVTRKRQQKIYNDALGRNVKTEVLNWDGAGSFGTGGTVYSTTVNTYNVRDQVALARQYQGTEASGIYQETAITYDGYGRVKTKHVPEQNAGTVTSWNYFDDDTIQSITDARGAAATYTYNNRHLVKTIDYSAPAGIATTPGVTFSYDDAGNRISMSDGLGSVGYNYNQLSQMTSETRTLNGLGTYTLSYDYNLAGQLKKITDPTNMSINYGYDRIGRLGSVTGSENLHGGVSQYVSGVTYRAWGGTKVLTYGNNYTLAVNYNARLQGTQFELAGRPAQYGPATVMKTQFDYYANGETKYARDLLDERYDRAFSYDHVAMLKEAYSGSEARDYVNGTNSGTPTGPYRQSYQHDTQGNLTQRQTRFWSQSDTFTASYDAATNHTAGWVYDAAGNVTADQDLQYQVDVAGRTRQLANATQIIIQAHDGDGRVVKRTKNNTTTYHLYSSVTGKVINEINSQGAKVIGYVFAGGELLARQVNNVVLWQHRNPLTGSRGESDYPGAFGSTSEPDPTGVNVGFEDPYINCCTGPPANESTAGLLAGPGVPEGRCVLDNVAFDCAQVLHFLDIGSAGVCPNNDCGPRVVHDEKGKPAIEPLRWDPNTGELGWWDWDPNYRRNQPNDDADSNIIRINNQGAYRWHHGTNNRFIGIGFGGMFFLGIVPQKPKPPYVDQNVLNGCTEKHFGVTTNSFTGSSSGNNGSFQGTGPSYLATNKHGAGNNDTFTIRNNATTYSTTYLTNLHNKFRVAAGQSPYSPGVTVHGTTNRFAPLVNYTGNNLSARQILSNQIHELGHSLDAITGIGYDSIKDDLGGQILQNCVRDMGGFR